MKEIYFSVHRRDLLQYFIEFSRHRGGGPENHSSSKTDCCQAKPSNYCSRRLNKHEINYSGGNKNQSFLLYHILLFKFKAFRDEKDNFRNSLHNHNVVFLFRFVC